MQVDASTFVTYPIARDATQRARAWALKAGWSPRTSASLEPAARTGAAGIRTSLRHVFYQNQGTAPRLMKELEGKVIPLKGPDGATRMVFVKDVGNPGWVTLPGGVKVWREQKWRHPGIKPSRFMQGALTESIEAAKPLLRREVRAMLGVD